MLSKPSTVKFYITFRGLPKTGGSIENEIHEHIRVDWIRSRSNHLLLGIICNRAAQLRVYLSGLNEFVDQL
jgi:hypothetical protein